jgi:hypothetical protein
MDKTIRPDMRPQPQQLKRSFAHRRATGELVDAAPEPQTQSEVTASQIVAAYRKTKGA